MSRRTLTIIALILAAVLATFATVTVRSLREPIGATQPAPTGTTATATNQASETTPKITGDNADFINGTLEAQVVGPKSSDIDSVFIATKKALDDLEYFRTGESLGKDSVIIYARAHGDIDITVKITRTATELPDGKMNDRITLAIRYDNFGNETQSIRIRNKIDELLNHSGN